jgi:hypothetical protein
MLCVLDVPCRSMVLYEVLLYKPELNWMLSHHLMPSNKNFFLSIQEIREGRCIQWSVTKRG